ncbi:XRE family transcriptional regulator [Chryseoglobus frigidaquae]|nr:XRE family transcriptional regulator [Microcella frigidaquae]
MRRARLDAGLTQSELASRAGISQPSLAQMERDTRTPSDEMLERVLRAADYRPSLPLADFASQISALAAKRGIERVRVFGSIVRGEDHFDSDIDLLVSPRPHVDLLDLALFAEEVRVMTGFPVDVVADTSDAPRVIDAAREAVGL